MRSPNAGKRLAEARAALADSSRRVAEHTARRNDALLADDDNAAIKLDGELEALRRTERAQLDKVRLLEQEAEAAERERKAQERLALIERIEKTLAERDAAGLKLQNTLIEADRQFRELIKLSEAASSQWPWPPSDLIPMLMSGATIARAVSHQLYKCGARPPLLGRPGEVIEAPFPGGVCVDHRLRGLVDQIPSLTDVLRDGTALASRIMRGGAAPATTPAASPPASDAASGNGGETPNPVRTPDQAKLAGLLKRQSQLAEDLSPEGEIAYQAVVAEIAALQS